jgi:predicted HTH domain antitoxin
MEEMLIVRVSVEIQQMLNRTPEEMSRDVRSYAALMLFQLGKLSSGAASAMAGIPRVMFLDMYADYGIPVSQVTGEDLHRSRTGI